MNTSVPLVQKGFWSREPNGFKTLVNNANMLLMAVTHHLSWVCLHFLFGFPSISVLFLYCLFTLTTLKTLLLPLSSHCFWTIPLLASLSDDDAVLTLCCWLLSVSIDILLMSCAWMSCSDFSLKDLWATFEFSMLFVKPSHFCETFTMYYP